MPAPTTIALAGNPNCGKTTLFNELTGSNGYVGNWPGVTVEKKMASWRSDHDVIFVDLPGIYSLSPYSPEEVVSRDYLVKERPDAVINLIDVTNLERSLYLATQVLEAGRPMVVGLNMCDLLKGRKDKIDAELLSERLGVPVLEVSALRNTNLDALVNAAVDAGRSGRAPGGVACFTPELEKALEDIQSILGDACAPELARWYAIKVFERDAEVLQELGLDEARRARAEAVIAAVEKDRDDDAESIVTSERYEWIATVVDDCVKKAPKQLTTSQKIDRVVTNRVLGLPIFAAVMIAVYWFALVAVGTPATDWVNDNLFSDGFFISAQGSADYTQAKEAWDEHHYADQIGGYLDAAKEAGVDVDGVQEAIDAEERGDEDVATISAFMKAAKDAGVTAEDVPITDEDGNFVDDEGEAITKEDADGNPILDEGQRQGLIPSVSLDQFKEAVETPEPDQHDYPGFVDSLPNAASGLLDGAGASDLVKSLVIDGIIGGVGSVLGFIPQIFFLFVALCFLEDCGYMSRVAFVMDRVFRRFGLSGKSFIPMIVSSGCGVPGVLATKTIENERDRRMTAMLTTMIPCSAKLPIIALVMGVLAGGSNMWWVAPLFYLMGIVAIVVSAVMLKKTRPFEGEPLPFVMELPAYHFPAVRSWFLHVWERVGAYVKKAGTIIFAAAVGIWFLSNFGVAGWEGGDGGFGFLPGMEGVPDSFMDYSILAGFGGALSFLFVPLGFGNWQAAASSISALIAKENLVSTFGVLYGLGGATENSVGMWQGFANMFTIGGTLHVGAMCAFVAFNMLCAPCFAAMGTIRRQMESARWTAFAIAYECIFGWVIGLFINQFYELVAFGQFGFWTVVAFVLLAAMLFQIFRPAPVWDKPDEKVLSSLTDPGEAA
ncbi:FeoB small GTPase domain-containing protein [Olsenella massiliensis]|uniref:FeoB small GTPase domain-containing protein n=1 Tax=Olsenella massiliensis TaxID=1622075 RepID=UPI00071C5E1E|nr:FeoB small GTPase domain-containing protein [Olsenella massiliensis]